MPHTLTHAEELFRFTSTRAPGRSASPLACLELGDDSTVAQWLAEATTINFAKQLAQLDKAWVAATSRAPEILFADLLKASRGTQADLDALLPAPLPRTDTLLVPLWQFYLQGIASGQVDEDALRRIYHMIVMATLLGTGQAALTPERLRSDIGRKIRLPAALADYLHSARSARVGSAAASHGQLRENQGQRLASLLAELGTLDQLERQLAEALTQTPQAELRLSGRSGNAHPGAPADMEHGIQHSFDVEQHFRSAHPGLVTALHAAGLDTGSLTGWQLLDQLRHKMAHVVAAIAEMKPQQGAMAQAALPLRELLAPALAAPVAVGEPVSSERFGIRALGVADLRVVRQVLVRYEKGELARISNVMMGEVYEQTLELVQNVAEAIDESEQQEGELTQEETASERYELGRETRAEAFQYAGSNYGLNYSDTYGTASINYSANVYEQHAQDESISESLKYSREVVDRAVLRIRDTISRSHYLSASIEYRDRERHKLSAETCNMIGQYRWVDKICQAQVYNYGARAMYELMVPRPAAMYLHLMAQADGGPLGQAPVRPDIRPGQITEATWLALARRHGVTLPPPPPSSLTEYAQLTFPSRMQDTPVAGGTFNMLRAQEKGYRAALGGCSMSWYGVRNQCGVTASIGARLFASSADPDHAIPSQALGSETGPLTYNASGWGSIQQYTVNFYVLWVRTRRALEDWQQACHTIIMDDYRARLARHAEQAKAGKDPAMTTDRMRTIEKTELRRAVLEIVRSANGSAAPASGIDLTGLPRIDVASLGHAAREVRFFEQAFEWDQMTYRFHPYFWNGSAQQWDASAYGNVGDDLFAAFLSAGFATVVLPVRCGFEDAAALYLQTGLVSGLPIEPSDPLLSQINREVAARNAQQDDGIPEGEAWQYRVPTRLLVLDEGNGHTLPDFAPSLSRPAVAFIAADETCDNQAYNKADWPDPHGIEVVTEMRKLGYPVSFSDPHAQIRTPMGQALVRAFQHFCNESGLARNVGARLLAEDGLMGPCTLRALSEARRLRRSGSWTGPSVD